MGNSNSSNSNSNSNSKILAGAVTSEQTRASEIGTAILKQGGNAVDAIIATTLAVGTLAHFHSDLGGGGFALIKTPQGEYETLNFRHTAPAAATAEQYRLGASTQVGGTAVAVPGQIKGLEDLHKRYGKLPWKDLFTPSIKLAREGYEMRDDLRGKVMLECNPPGSTNLKGSWMESDPIYHPFFKDEQVLGSKDIYYRPEYARTLEIIAEKGSKGFYEGPVAEGLIKAVRNKGGLMTLDDLRNYKTNWGKPISGKYRDYTLYTFPAPASGTTWLSAMSILSHFEPAGSGTVLDHHRVAEALRLAYGQRTDLGDPDFEDGIPEKELSWIGSEDITARAKMLDDKKTHPPEYYKPPKVEIKDDAGTSHIIAADSEGMIVSLTTTIGLNFGSRIMVPGYGFVLNDSMDDFSVEGKSNATGYEPSPANYGVPILMVNAMSKEELTKIVVGGKRPLSSSCPYIVEDSQGKVVLSGGSSGGSKIISANVQIARNVLDYGMTAAEAMRQNRLHDQILPNVTMLETGVTHQGITVDGFSEEVGKGLEEKGHVLQWVKQHPTNPCAMKFYYNPQIDWEAAGDPRYEDTGGSVFHPEK